MGTWMRDFRLSIDSLLLKELFICCLSSVSMDRSSRSDTLVIIAFYFFSLSVDREAATEATTASKRASAMEL